MLSAPTLRHALVIATRFGEDLTFTWLRFGLDIGGREVVFSLGDREPLHGAVRDFLCDRRALVPRPETEQLAEWVLAWAPLWARPKPVVADVGTGSGCLAVTLALERPAARVLATDTSSDALALARENAARHGVGGRLWFRQQDLLAGQPPASLDAVVSNPPYVATADWARCAATVRDFEPRAALDGGPDGLAVIRRLVRQARDALAPGGALFLEIGDRQAGAVRALLEAAGFADACVRRDHAGRDRLLRAVRPAARLSRPARRPETLARGCPVPYAESGPVRPPEEPP